MLLECVSITPQHLTDETEIDILTGVILEIISRQYQIFDLCYLKFNYRFPIVFSQGIVLRINSPFLSAVIMCSCFQVHTKQQMINLPL